MSKLACWCLLAIAVGCARGQRIRDPENVAGKVLEDLGYLIADKNSSDTTGLDWHINEVLANIYFSDGTMRNLSSLELVGDRHVINKTVFDDRTVYEYHVTVGLRELKYFNRYDWRLILKRGGGRLIVGLPHASVKVMGTVTLRSSGSCDAAIPTPTLQDYGVFDMRVVPDNGDSLPWAIGNLVEIYLNHNDDKGNRYKADFIRQAVQNIANIVSLTEFNDIVCKYITQL